MKEMLRTRKEPNERKQLMVSAKLNHKLDCKLCKIEGENLFEEPFNKTF